MLTETEIAWTGTACRWLSQLGVRLIETPLWQGTAYVASLPLSHGGGVLFCGADHTRELALMSACWELAVKLGAHDLAAACPRHFT